MTDLDDPQSDKNLLHIETNPQQPNDQPTKNNHEWLQLQQDWQAYQPDIVGIKKKIAWVTWRMISILVIDVLGMMLYVPYVVFWVAPNDAPLVYKLLSYAVIPLGFLGVFIDFKLRLPVLRLDRGSTRDVLKSYLKLVQAGVRIGLWGYRSVLVMLFLFIIWVIAVHYSTPNNEILVDPERLFLVFILLVITAAAMFWYMRKKAKEEQKLSALWKEYIS